MSDGRCPRLIPALLLLGALAGCVVDVDLGRSSTADAARTDALAPPPADAFDPDASDLDLAGTDAIATDAITPDVITPDAIALDLTLPDALPVDSHPADATLTDMTPADMTPALNCPRCLTALAARIEDCAAPADCPIPSAALDTCLVDHCALPTIDDCALCRPRAERLRTLCQQWAAPETCDHLATLVAEDCGRRCGPPDCADCCADCLRDAIPPTPCAAVPPTACGPALVERFATCHPACEDTADAMIACADRAGARHALCGDRGAECDRALAVMVESCRLTGANGHCAACDSRRASEQMACLAIGFDPAICGARDASFGAICVAHCAADAITLCTHTGRLAASSCEASGGERCGELASVVSSHCLGAAGIAVPPCLGCLTTALGAAGGCVDRAPDACLTAIEEPWSRCLAGCGEARSGGGCLACGLEADRQLGRCLAEGGAVPRCFAARAAAETACLGRCGGVRPEALPCALRGRLLGERCLAAEPVDALCLESAARLEAACRFARGE